MDYRSKPATQKVLSLYCLVGEAICAIQHVEDALSHSITLKKDVKISCRIPEPEANKVLEKYRSLTLGRAVELSKKEKIYSEHLLKELEEFSSERNWLVHKSIARGRDGGDSNLFAEKFFKRIKEINNQARRIQHSIEEDLMNFSEANGVDMSGVRAEIRKFYAEG